MRAPAIVRVRRLALPSILAILAFIPGVPGAAQAQGLYSTSTLEGPRAAAVHKWMLSRLSSGFSGAVLIAEGDNVVLRAGYGVANAEKGIPWTSSIVGQIGSISKQFTAAAIMDLWDRKLLKPTDSVGKFFPTFTTKATRGITIHQLLSHTSGLPDFIGDDFESEPRDSMLKKALRRAPLSPPGALFSSSSVAFSVLAAIVEKVSGKTLDSYLHSRFFTPLKMQNTGYLLTNVARDSLAMGYFNGKPIGNVLDSIAPLGRDYWNLYGNGGMQSSPEEMFRWFRALRNGKVLTARSRAALWAPQSVRGNGAEYGYGWSIRRDSAGALEQVSHSGSDRVFVATITWIPQGDIFVYMVSNFGQEQYVAATVAGVLRIVRGGTAP